ncbi:TonB-dependent receptor domain-containing protein [Futiania mangrovi]|uniref:TonB-dependent receptor n=1 Tax=Futiania mangrovi TaxID=2959716 RepID=A0A9J6PHA4_9PROT|nr:TonB-dependent receptor [Futiania mangrovii]MCP1337886.1 TonB-dependent receptor [Futiania mangrovii]
MRAHLGMGAAALFLVAGAAMESHAADSRSCDQLAGRVISAQGSVEYRAGSDWRRAGLDQELCDRDAIRTGANSRAAVQLADDAVLRLDANTTLVLSDVTPEPQERSFLQLVVGAIHSFSRSPRTLKVDTPYINATIEGTEFALRVTETDSTLTVVEGLVVASNDRGTLDVSSGSAARADATSAPRSVVVVRPRDAVTWGLYYPPALSMEPTAAVDPASMIEAQRLVERGRTDAAIARLREDGTPTMRARLYLASLYMSVGRADEARQVLDGVLRAEPGNGDALALSAVIDVVRNENASAMTKAQRAVEVSPDSAAPYIALSLAQQSEFRLEEARDTLLAGAARVPDSALIQARLSEIWLSLGYRDRSGEAADRALALDPELQRAHVMKGFAALTEYRTADAKAAFDKAVVLDEADPMPRLGRGLALIREGDLTAGRGELDAAVALDSNRSLLRSYLGKAYFEEERSPLAREQYVIAKELDPQDPTPYLYEAIRLQTENRPGEALAEIQQSIARNDNRAVYRGRLQLDQDAAARGASLGRIYEDLGFIALGMREAARSQNIDPANAAAHRFLADLYRNERRRELARVSELTRSQLLQGLTLSPVQPSLTETNLNLVSSGGPANAGFNEYTSLFDSDGTRITATGSVGNDQTLGGEVAVAGRQGNVAASLGIFQFRSDGFRYNFDASHSIYNAFGQWAVSPEVTLQIEARHRETVNGDLAMNFDPDDYDPYFEQSLRDNSLRLGMKLAPDPRNTTLVSLLYSHRRASETATQGFINIGLGPQPFFLNTNIDAKSFQTEVQHIYQADAFNLTFGASMTSSDEESNSYFSTAVLPPIASGLQALDSEDYRAYAYGSFILPQDLTLTAGLSLQDFESGPKDVSGVNPKFGLEWRPLPSVALRAAYTQVIKPPLVSNRTIEPTQVAGFNQYFDDGNGAKSRRWGFGVDWQISDTMFAGAEATWRRIDEPVQLTPASAIYPDHEEETHRFYFSMLPHPRVPVGIEFVYDRFKAEPSVLTNIGPVPLEMQTFSIPLTARYFDPSGFFGGVRATYVNQDVERAAGSAFADGQSDFFVVDADVGYRFPNRAGSFSLEVRNLFDSGFSYQDDGFREFGDEPSTGPYFPSATVMGRLTLNF